MIVEVSTSVANTSMSVGATAPFAQDPRVIELQEMLPRCLLPDWVRLGARAVRLFRDRHHPDAHDALLGRLLEAARESVAIRQRRAAQVPRPTYPTNLPITARKDEIVAAIRAHPVIVIAGETGSGKTTQIPKMCLEAGLGIEAKIGCTQPRRVAALSISQRLAEELQVKWGREVGCKIRFDDRSGADTYIKLMTDGILLAETQGDPTLAEYNALIIDEAHERSLNIDFLLGHLKGLLSRRPDLKLIITSATIDTAAFSRHFNDAPVIEVSGRTYPVEVFYQPLDAEAEDRGELSFVDGAVRATLQALDNSTEGDVLIFMPGERDIRETADQLEGRVGREAQIIPLYGRLATGDQQQVFAPSERRKIVVATNIAETSLTIPGIRFVIDSGLARISRYTARTRTKRLPVEAVSRSSADQRKGRAGRVEAGVCIRLYSEEDFLARPQFTQPEIQRANLAEVILRMKAFQLGEIETFPFVNPPAPAAISGGYALLQELGALDAERQLTPLGRDLARLPIDPTLGRMLLQSQVEHAPHELLIIAAGLSIQDPRERPLDQRDAADAAHRRHIDPRSDFLTLLNLWNAVHDQWEVLRTQNQRRQFCRQQFLSYTRMREWQDLYAQLHGALENLGTLQLNESSADYDAIHRSVLSGLLGHVAVREDRNEYKAAGNRIVALFPGSVLFERGQSPRKGPPGKDRRAAAAPAEPKSKQPAWIVAGEIVETSQLFIRTIAGIDPQWILQLAPHLCAVTHQNPHWSPEAGRVLVEEIHRFHGLEIARRKVAYGNIAPAAATLLFIRSALVEENLFPDPLRNRHDQAIDGIDPDAEIRDALRQPTQPEPEGGLDARIATQFPFVAHNHGVRQQIEHWQTRCRFDVGDVDVALEKFYLGHFTGISSLDELRRFLRGLPDPAVLHVTSVDLIGAQELAYDPEAFPEAVAVGGQPVPVRYAYAPGEDHDGVTVQLPSALVDCVPAAALEWAVPGLREQRIEELLRALPKTLRRELMPFPPKVKEIVREFRPTGAAFLTELARFLTQRYGVMVTPDSWAGETGSAHLRPRIELLTADRKVLAAGRDLAELKRQLPASAHGPLGDPPAWREAVRQWERGGLTGWTFGDLPERITVLEDVRFPLYAWPGLEVEAGHVNLRLFRTRDASQRSSLPAVQLWVGAALARELAWLERDLRQLVRFAADYAPLGPVEELQESALVQLKRHLLPAAALPVLTQARFLKAIETARSQLPGLVSTLATHVGNCLQLFNQLRSRLAALGGSPVAGKSSRSGAAGVRLNDLSQLMLPAARPAQVAAANRPASTSNPAVTHWLATEIETLMPPRFLEALPFTQLPHWPRYLKALLMRVERASNNLLKDQERARLVGPYVDSWRNLPPPAKLPEAARAAQMEYRWLLEEYKVSVFAQELGTAQPVSPKRLDQQLERLRDLAAMP